MVYYKRRRNTFYVGLSSALDNSRVFWIWHNTYIKLWSKIWDVINKELFVAQKKVLCVGHENSFLVTYIKIKKWFIISTEREIKLIKQKASINTLENKSFSFCEYISPVKVFLWSFCKSCWKGMFYSGELIGKPLL